MKRRREHVECETREGGRGCLILGTRVCTFRKKQMASEILKRWVRGCMRGNGMIWWVTIALLGVAVAVADGWMRTRRLEAQVAY
jgi:hypothetical protein